MGYRQKCFDAHGDRCIACESEADIAHHIDGDRTNNAEDNLAPLCYSCHQRVHSENTIVEEWDEESPDLAPKGLLSGDNDTTITISEWTKEELDEYRAEGVTWSEYVLWLLQRAVKNSGSSGGDTGLTISEDTKSRLGLHRADAHHSWNDTLHSFMDVMPTPEDVQEGCAYCDRQLRWEGTIEDTGGCINFFRAEYDGEYIYGSNYYCSAECAHEAQQEAQKHVPERPDTVLVGGKGEPVTGYGDASFYMDGKTMEVGFDIPGAFAGTDAHGNEYDYLGEPVYIKNEGMWVQSGVIEDIIHEETHTALLLDYDHEVEMLHHPDEERRMDYRERHEKRESDECAACGVEFSYPVKDAPEECPECGDEEW